MEVWHVAAQRADVLERLRHHLARLCIILLAGRDSTQSVPRAFKAQDNHSAAQYKLPDRAYRSNMLCGKTMTPSRAKPHVHGLSRTTVFRKQTAILTAPAHRDQHPQTHIKPPLFP